MTQQFDSLSSSEMPDSVETNQPTFPPGAEVHRFDNPARTGIVTKKQPQQRSAGRRVEVSWQDGARDWCYESELEWVEDVDNGDVYALVQRGSYGNASNLRRTLTYVHLSGRLADLVYSMGITSTDFYPHQYRPLLALLDSPSSGLVIADEVGLGKTIEAGLIWTEMRARHDMRRLLVVCPAMLQEKWRDELRLKFGVDARIVGAVELLDELQAPRQTLGEGRAWIVSYSAARPPKEFKEGAATPSRPSAKWRLAQYLFDQAQNDPCIDMVIFDEAHYMRNRETSTWRLGHLLCEISLYRLMLSATPINLHNEDLRSLLQLIDPDTFEHPEVFNQLLQANEPLLVARDRVLDSRINAAEILTALDALQDNELLAHSKRVDEIIANPPSDTDLADRSYRAILANKLERLDLLSHVLTRTRKRDVHEKRPKRVPVRNAVNMSEHEQQLYELITRETRRYAEQRGISTGFLLVTPQRQVTSCPAAFAESCARPRTDEDPYADSYEDDSDDDEIDCDAKLRAHLERRVLSEIDIPRLRENDTKFSALMGQIKVFLDEDASQKIIIFTSYRATARYLADRLTEARMQSLLLRGGQSESKQERIHRFRDTRDIRVLVSTEVASEGVDLQFCKVLINYDLPWNPTRVEQRIGRIDRYGQESDLIHIVNLYFAGSIDDRVLYRLLERLKVFDAAFGESEAIVGDEIRRLESRLLSRSMNAEEEAAQIDKSAQAVENIVVQRQQLEENAPHMMAGGQRVLDQIEAAKDLSRRITDEDIYVYISDYLKRHAPNHELRRDDKDSNLFHIKLPASTTADLDSYLRSQGLLGRTRLATGDHVHARLVNKISEQAPRGEEIIHQFHPLIRFISHDLGKRNEGTYALLAVSVDRTADFDLPAGEYVFYCMRFVFEGVRDEEHLKFQVGKRTDGAFELCSPESSEELVQLARLRGNDWPGAGNSLNAQLIERALYETEEALDKRYQSMLDEKKAENEDRANAQIETIKSRIQRVEARDQSIAAQHASAGRESLSKATLAKYEKEKQRLNNRIREIETQQVIRPTRYQVCAGVIRLI